MIICTNQPFFNRIQTLWKWLIHVFRLVYEVNLTYTKLAFYKWFTLTIDTFQVTRIPLFALKDKLPSQNQKGLAVVRLVITVSAF